MQLKDMTGIGTFGMKGKFWSRWRDQRTLWGTLNVLASYLDVPSGSNLLQPRLQGAFPSLRKAGKSALGTRLNLVIKQGVWATLRQNVYALRKRQVEHFRSLSVTFSVTPFHSLPRAHSRPQSPSFLGHVVRKSVTN